MSVHFEQMPSLVTDSQPIERDLALDGHIGAPFRVANSVFIVTDKGREALAEESEAMRFLRRRNELSGRLSLIEQAYWIRNRDEQQDTSSAQPHRFRSAE